MPVKIRCLQRLQILSALITGSISYQIVDWS
jgi:hypothetical protein